MDVVDNFYVCERTLKISMTLRIFRCEENKESIVLHKISSTTSSNYSTMTRCYCWEHYNQSSCLPFGHGVAWNRKEKIRKLKMVIYKERGIYRWHPGPCLYEVNKCLRWCPFTNNLRTFPSRSLMMYELKPMTFWTW